MTRHVLHLRLTPSSILRMVLYIEPSKEDWYTENSQKLFTALQPVILQHLVGGEQGKPITRQNRKLETPKILSEADYSLVYRFKWHDVQQSILLREHDYIFVGQSEGAEEEEEEYAEERDEDEKPERHTRYQPLSLYPYHLYVSVADPQKTESIDRYWAAS